MITQIGLNTKTSVDQIQQKIRSLSVLVPFEDSFRVENTKNI